MHGNYNNRSKNYLKDDVTLMPTDNIITMTTDNDEAQPEAIAQHIIAEGDTDSSITASLELSKKNVIGIVNNCTSLNVRANPNLAAPIITTIPVGTEVMIDDTHSTSDFYKVCNAAGIEGYCVKRYIKIQS